MRVCYQGFYGQNHSWSTVAQNITRSLIELNNTVDVFSTNGTAKIPEDLLPNVVGSVEDKKQVGIMPGNDYDMSLSYTALKNFSYFIQHSKKNRFGIWCYEFNGKNSLPTGFAKAHRSVDRILPPSKFAKEVFLNSGMPEDKMTVIPHGVNLREIDAAIPYPLKTNKSIKILINLGQIHQRKNLDGALKMLGIAFTKKDDVCFVLKVQEKKPKYGFEVSFQDSYKLFTQSYPDHPEVEIIKDFIPNIYSLYKSCDITFSPSHAEGFGMVPLEGMACGVVPIASRYGGFLDFLNDNNSLLIDGKEFKVPVSWLYYDGKPGTTAFLPSVDDGVEKLRFAVNNMSNLKKRTSEQVSEVRETFSWLNITKQILALVE